jgi:hypothetical protein
MPTLGWQYLLGFSSIPIFFFCIMCYVSQYLQSKLEQHFFKSEYFVEFEFHKSAYAYLTLLLDHSVASRERQISRCERPNRESHGYVGTNSGRQQAAHALRKTHC